MFERAKSCIESFEPSAPSLSSVSTPTSSISASPGSIIFPLTKEEVHYCTGS